MRAHLFGLAVLALALVGMLGACAATPKKRVSPPVAPAALKIALPNKASGPLAQKLRQSLTARGWSLLGYNAAQLQQRGDYTLLARRARYRLTLTARRIGNCPAGGPSYKYNLALIANRGGHVLVALTGAQCLNDIVDAFETDLDRRQLIAPGTAGSGGG